MIPRAILFAALALLPTAAGAQQQDAYHDDRARELVRLALARREVADRAITSYTATAKERMSAGLRTPLRDRLLYRREIASRIDWQRDGPITVTVLGAREAVPIALPGAHLPGDLQDITQLAFDPMDREGLIRLDTLVLRDPLSPGAEAHYRYRTGDSTTIVLADRSIKLLELRIEPRRAEVNLLRGSFWLDGETHAVVQAVFRLARNYEFELRADSGSVNLVDRQAPATAAVGVQRTDSARPVRRIPLPGFFKPMRAELEYVTIDYAYVHLRWWMPQLISAAGSFQLGNLRAPLHYERSYSYDQISGDSSAASSAKNALRDSISEGTLVRCRPFSAPPAMEGEGEWFQHYRTRREAALERRRTRLDSLVATGDTAAARRARLRHACADRYRLVLGDSLEMIASPELPPTVYGGTAELAGAAELQKIAERIQNLPLAPWNLRRPSFSWGPFGNGLVRHNKVEGLALGARSDIDLGRVRLDLTGHFGTADLQPKLEAGLTQTTTRSVNRFGLYRRLAVMDRASGLGGAGATMSALLFGNDDRSYYRATGADLSFSPANTKARWYDVRLFAEQQRPLAQETNASLARVFNGTHAFSPNLPATAADQAGAELTLRAERGQNPLGLRWSTELNVLASGGTFNFTRESLKLRVGFPLPFHLAGAVEGMAGTSTGAFPLQSAWFLGGSQSVRGYDIGTWYGSAFWRARAELGLGIPAARLTAFTDLGWAGDRNSSADRASLFSAGIGASFLDGLIRVDLARALRYRTGWKLHLGIDGIL